MTSGPIQLVKNNPLNIYGKMPPCGDHDSCGHLACGPDYGLAPTIRTKNYPGMFQKVKESHTIAYLIIGFSVFVVLLSISWYVTTNHLEEQMQLNASTKAAAEKMHLITKSIEIVRKRTRLSHEMLLTDDVFVKDEIAMEINSLAADFVLNRDELNSLNLTAEEKAVLDAQRPVYPELISNLNTVAELALEDTEEATQRARNIIVRDIVPAQGRIIDGFTLLMRIIEEKVNTDSRALLEKRQTNHNVRLALLFFILVVALITSLLVTKHVLNVENKLRDLSTTDGLTGIFNRRLFDSKIKEQWNNASRYGKPLALLLIDIDHFKKYNDRYGHQEGDNCLIRVAGIISNVAYRSGDIVARYGGEEFAALLVNVDEAGARSVAERMLQEVRKENIPHVESETEQHLTISIGYASMVPDSVNSIEDLIKVADDGLYESKKTGRNRASCIAVSGKQPVAVSA